MLSNLLFQSLGRSTYVHYHGGKGSIQRLEESIRQHVSKVIRNKIKAQNDLPRRQRKSTQNTPISNSSNKRF